MVSTENDTAGSPYTSLTFVIGGARSGKSRHAEHLAMQATPPWTYIATAEAWDTEMAERIALHRTRRDERWRTVDAPHDLVAALDARAPGETVLVDCLTLWLSNRMLEDADIDAEVDALAGRLSRPAGRWIVVANEVGLGIVPDNALARRFRDAAGRLNQAVATTAGTVVLTVAGIPMRVK